MNLWKRFWGHLRTVNKHRRMVRKLCFKAGLYWQGLTHDLSKYSFVEFWNGVKYFIGTASPHVGERKALGYSKAWIHHHNRNKHHGEYWQDIDKNGKHCPIDIPNRYFMEMICDRVAASMIYLKDKFTDRAPLEYYLTHKDENQFSENTHAQLEKTLNFIAEEGIYNFLSEYRTRKKRGIE